MLKQGQSGDSGEQGKANGISRSGGRVQAFEPAGDSESQGRDRNGKDPVQARNAEMAGQMH